MDQVTASKRALARLEEPPSWLNEHFNRFNRQWIRKAWRLAYRCHAHEVRQDHLPYFTHPVAVAEIIIKEFHIYDAQLVIAALLHDAREIKQPRVVVTRRSLQHCLGDEAEADNHALTRKVHSGNKKEPKAVYLKRITDQGWRTLVTKIADRLHNLRTLNNCSPEKQWRVYQETREYYLSLIPLLRKMLPVQWKLMGDTVERILKTELNYLERTLPPLPTKKAPGV